MSANVEYEYGTAVVHSHKHTEQLDDGKQKRLFYNPCSSIEPQTTLKIS